MVQVGRDHICYSKPRNYRWAVCIKAILHCFTWALSPLGTQKQGGAQMTQVGQFCPAWPQNTLFYVHGSNLAKRNSQQDQVSTGKKPSRGGHKGAQELGVMGRKQTGKKKWLPRGMLTLKKSQRGKKVGGERKPSWITSIKEHEHQL